MPKVRSGKDRRTSSLRDSEYTCFRGRRAGPERKQHTRFDASNPGSATFSPFGANVKALFQKEVISNETTNSTFLSRSQSLIPSAQYFSSVTFPGVVILPASVSPANSAASGLPHSISSSSFALILFGIIVLLVRWFSIENLSI